MVLPKHRLLESAMESAYAIGGIEAMTRVIDANAAGKLMCRDFQCMKAKKVMKAREKAMKAREKAMKARKKAMKAKKK